MALTPLEQQIWDLNRRNTTTSGSGGSGAGSIAGVAIDKNTSGTPIGTRPEINFIEGSNILLTIADNAVNDAVDVTVASTTVGSGTFINDYYVDQSGGTGDTYGILSGVLNGSNTTFTVSQGSYASSTLEVYLNGQIQVQGTGEDWTETTPGSGTFDFAIAPQATDEIGVRYAVSITSSGTILLARTLQEESSNYTLLDTDLGVDVDASGGGITITLPPLASVQGLVYYISKTDASVNVVTVEGDGAETINGNLNDTLISQYDNFILLANSTEWIAR